MKLPITQTASEQLMRAINTEESILFTKIELVGLTTHTITDVRKPADGTAVGVSVIVDKQDLQGNPRFDVLRIYAKVGSGVEFLFATTGITIDFSGDEDRRLILTVYLDITNSEEVTFEYSGGGSAYDVAIAQGFEGTAQEWLDSLRVTVDRYTRDSRGDTVIHFTDSKDVIIETGEADRVASENARVTAESERISNEEARQENEQGRESTESVRVSNEEERHRHYNGLIDTGIMEANINQKLADAEKQYAPRLAELEQNDASFFNAIELTGSNSTLDLSVSKTFYQELSTMAQYSFKADEEAESFKLILKTTGATYPIIFPRNVIWYENKLPELSQPYSTYILEFSTKDGGDYWYGNVAFRDFGTLPTGYVWATDDDFSGDANGQFKYIGADVKVAIPRVIKGVPVTSYVEMFRDTGVSGAYSDNRNVTNMQAMFYGSSATTLDLSSFDTSNVTNMSHMFYLASATTLDLSNFDTSNVTAMDAMFSRSSATTLDLSSFNTSNVTNMSHMFYLASATTLDLSSFDTSNVTNMHAMFSSSSATTLDLSSFNTSNVTNMQAMFYLASATTGYARTQTDTDKLNASSHKPSTLNFIVK